MRSINGINRNGRKWTTEEFQELIGMWLRDEDTQSIATHFNLSITGLTKLVQRLRRNGIPLPLRRAGHKSGRRNMPWTQEEVETVVRMRNERKSTTDIAIALDRTFYGVQNMIMTLRNEEGVPVISLGKGMRRLWDPQRLRDAVAGRGLIPQLTVVKKIAA